MTGPESPIERVARFLGTSAHVHPVEVLVPEQCMLVSIKGELYHLTIEKVGAGPIPEHGTLRIKAKRLADLCSTDTPDEDFNAAVTALREELE